MSPEQAAGPDSGDSGPERRRYERIDCRLTVRYRHVVQGIVTSWKDSLAGNISAGGLFLLRGEQIRVGMLMELEISVPGLLTPITTPAKVVWKGGGTSVVECGFEFSQLKAHDRAFINKFIRERKSGDKPPG